MSADVIDLDSRRPVRESHCGCLPGRVCYPHRLTNLRDLLHAELDDMDVLLVDRVTVERMAGHVLALIESITTECLPTDERTAR